MNLGYQNPAGEVTRPTRSLTSETLVWIFELELGKLERSLKRVN